MTVHLADLPRDKLETITLRLQSRQRRLRFFIEELAAHSDWVKKRLERFDMESPEAPAWLERILQEGARREFEGELAQRRAQVNDVKVWAKVDEVPGERLSP